MEPDVRYEVQDEEGWQYRYKIFWVRYGGIYPGERYFIDMIERREKEGWEFRYQNNRSEEGIVTMVFRQDKCAHGSGTTH